MYSDRARSTMLGGEKECRRGFEPGSEMAQGRAERPSVALTDGEGMRWPEDLEGREKTFSLGVNRAPARGERKPFPGKRRGGVFMAWLKVGKPLRSQEVRERTVQKPWNRRADEAGSLTAILQALSGGAGRAPISGKSRLILESGQGAKTEERGEGR